MRKLAFQPFHPEMNLAETVMIDGYAPDFRMISHWPGHTTPERLRHDVTTGSALAFAKLSQTEQFELLGRFCVVTNNHYDTDGAMSLFAMLNPIRALGRADLLVRTARSGDFAVWSGEDALALDLSVTADLAEFLPFSTPPFDDERLGNLSRAYLRMFDRMEALLADPFALQESWHNRFHQVMRDLARIEQGQGVAVARYPEEDLAVVESDRPITTFGLRYAAGDLFRVLLIHTRPDGNRYRFCFRGESWWDVVSVRPLPRVRLDDAARRLNELESNPRRARWWTTPLDWPVPELGFGEPVRLQNQAARWDPLTDADPPSRLSRETVVSTLRGALSEGAPFDPAAAVVGELSL